MIKFTDIEGEEIECIKIFSLQVHNQKVVRKDDVFYSGYFEFDDGIDEFEITRKEFHRLLKLLEQ